MYAILETIQGSLEEYDILYASCKHTGNFFNSKEKAEKYIKTLITNRLRNYNLFGNQGKEIDIDALINNKILIKVNKPFINGLEELDDTYSLIPHTLFTVTEIKVKDDETFNDEE